MKIAGKRIPRGTVLLTMSFMAISLCLLLIVSAVRSERVNRLGRSGMYSGNQRNFSLLCAEDENQWEEVMGPLASAQDDFAVYLSVQDPQMVVKGICVDGEVETPPMVWGEYFGFDTSWTDTPTAVLGRQYLEKTVMRDGKTYYSHGGTEFEVIGVMGTKEESRLNHMMIIDFKSAVRLCGINSVYVLDAKDESGVLETGKELETLFHSPASLVINLEKKKWGSFTAQFFSSGAIMDTMYVMILISFLLSTVLVTMIWLRFRNQLFFACSLCGYGRRATGLEIAKRFYASAGVGFVAGLLCMFLAASAIAGIHILWFDIIKAFGVTVGFGTGILLWCYVLRNPGSPIKRK